MRRGWDTRDAGDNDRQAFVAVLSLGPIAAIEGQTVDRNPVNYTATGAAIGAFAGFMWSMTQLGALASPALAFGAGAGTPPGVGADFKLSGKAAATWTLRFDTKAKQYQNGVPAPMWTVRGALAYDPTKDSTYPGGNGPHRMADPADTAAYDAAVATWEWTENPYLLGLRWAHGYWQRDVSNPASTYQRVMGMGSPWRLIDVAAFVEGRNIAAANGWTAGGMIYSRDEKWATMKKILQAGMGEPMPLGARISCLVNAPKVSLATVTIQDVIGSARVATTQPRRNRINTVTPRYRLEENNWQFLPGSPISIAEHIAEDGGKRSKVLDYPFIQITKQIGTAVRYDIENSREFGPITLPLKLFWMGYKPGDCVTADLPEVGLNRQPILLLNRDLDPAGGVTTFTARSETTAKHAFALGQVATPPPTPGVSGPPLVPVPSNTAWAITALSLVSQAQTIPALVVTGAVDAGTADAVLIEYRPFVSGQPLGAGWTSAGTWSVGATRAEITSVRSGVAYEVGISYQRNGIPGARRIIGPVVTAGTALDFDAVTGPNRPENKATNSALPSSPIGPDRTVAEVLSSLDVNVLAILAQALRQDQLLEVFDQRTLIEGQPVGTKFLAFRDQASDPVTGFARAVDFSSVFAKAKDGTGWTMNLQAVKAGNATFSDVLAGYNTKIGALRADVGDLGNVTGTLAQNLSQVSALAGNTSAKVTTLNQAFASPSGLGFAKALTTVDVNGRIAGYSATSDGKEGVFHIVADRFLVSDPDDPDGAVAPLSVVNKIVHAKNFEADIVTYGALVDKFAGSRQLLDPAGGFQELPGGFIVQWGRYRQQIGSEVSFSVVFPKPFPNAVMAVLPVGYIAVASDTRDLWLQNLGEPSVNGASFYTQAANTNDRKIDGFDWIALGK